MQQKAIVLHTEGAHATVRVMRQDACAHCHANCGGSCAKAVQATAQNPVGAVAGDTVLLESSTARILTFAALLFCAPILLAITSYFLWAALAESTLLVYSLSVATGVVSFLLIGLVCERIARKNPDLSIIEIIAPPTAQNGVTDDRA